MRSTMLKSFLLIVVFTLTSILCPHPGMADDQNYQNYVVGERAAGMGGATTAFSDAPEGTFYNPGGLVFIKDNRISLSANIARYTKGSITNAIVIGNVRKDLSLSSLEFVPVSSVALRRFNLRWDKKTSIKDKKNVLALSFYTPESTQYEGKEEVAQGAVEALLRYRIENAVRFAGPSYARKLSDSLGVGVSVFYTLRKFARETFLSATTSATTFVHNFSNNDYSYGGLVALLGVKWWATPKWHLGLSIRPYSLRLHGSGEANASNATELGASGTNPTRTILNNLRVNLPTPMKVTGGIGYRSGDRLTLAGDVSVYMPNEFAGIHDPQGRVADVRIEQKLIFNGNIGMEYRMREKFPVRAGFYTNYSSAPSLGTSSTNSRIDYYTGTASIGYERENYATNVGLQLAYGTGETLAAGQTNDFNLIHLTAMIATSFRF